MDLYWLPIVLRRCSFHMEEIKEIGARGNIYAKLIQSSFFMPFYGLTITFQYGTDHLKRKYEIRRCTNMPFILRHLLYPHLKSMADPCTTLCQQMALFIHVNTDQFCCARYRRAHS
ncbi:hypothetical protein XENTR_v10022465 [Xenopus tropicalis]|nr:hypothetical protein XENTR_v10022465 [Xenopus tropicalis]